MHWDQHERVLAVQVEEQPCSGLDLGALELLPSSAVTFGAKGKTIDLLYRCTHSTGGLCSGFSCLWGTWCPRPRASQQLFSMPGLQALGTSEEVIEDIKKAKKAQAWLATVTP